MLSRVEKARRHISEECEALKSPSPDEVTNAIPNLEEAVDCLFQLEKYIVGKDLGVAAPASASLLAELAGLKGDLKLAQQMTLHGAALNHGLLRRLAAVLGGYTSGGEPVEIKASGDVSIRG